jgi:4-hydroxy-3-polyprenylbenzoate decarboxylase
MSVPRIGEPAHDLAPASIILYNGAMNYRSLRDFLEDLRSSDDLEILEAGVDPVDEAARVARKIADESGKAVLLRSVKGHDLPVAVNLFGSERRICRALGVECLERLAERVCEQMSPRQSGLLDNLLGAAQGDSVAGINPRIVRSAPCQQIVRLGGDVDLAFLPLLRATPAENSSWIPAAPVIARSPDSQQAMSGRFDVQLVDGHRLAVCFAEYDDLARHWQNSRQRNEKLPLAIVFGGEPAFMLASAAVLPGKIDACALAGLFRDKPLDVVSCRSVELTVPAEAEIVLEGYLDPQLPPVTAGAMLSPLGEMTAPRPAPVMQATAITHRANPVYPAIFYGKPPHELSTVARAMKQIFLPVIQAAFEDLVDYELPEFAAARLWATLSIRKSYAGQAQHMARAVAGLRPFWFAKWLVVVDEDVDVRDNAAVLAAMSANVDPTRDIGTHEIVCDPYDPAAAPKMFGTRMVVDATAKK